MSPSKPAPTPEPNPDLDPGSCELVCADVHTCLLADGQTLAAASAIELGCLDGCVRAPTGFADCRMATPEGPAACDEYLGCVRQVWPPTDRPPAIVEAPPDYCALICAAFGACSDLSTDAIEVAECVDQCRVKLDPALQPSAAECAKLDGCPAIEACVRSIPGA